MISCGRITLPTDFDIFRPSRSIRNPCVSTSRNGGRPRVASPTSSELWNQPRCWSLPSRYRSAGQVSSGRKGNTASWLDPESNQTEDVALTDERPRATGGTRQPFRQELLDRPLVPRVCAVLLE